VEQLVSPEPKVLEAEAYPKNSKFKGLMNAQTLEVKGENMVEGIIWKDRKTGEVHDMKAGGVFVEIGSISNSDFVKGIVELNKIGEIIVDHKTQRSSQEGIWAAGDVSDVLYKQNNISMGDAVKALEDIYLYLQKNQ
jgi:alkyl hydroperoxide reductase subunit AhpF